MFVLKEFEFDAAHYLPEYNGKCERLLCAYPDDC